MRYVVHIFVEDDKNPNPLDPDELEKWATTVTRAMCRFTGASGSVYGVEKIEDDGYPEDSQSIAPRYPSRE